VWIVVGSGFFGLTFAQKLAESGKRVKIIEKRSHIAGNAFSEIDATTGIEVHRYGSHLFHTSNQRVWDYCNRFTSFTEYQHKVWTVHKDNFYSLPINLGTISSFFGKSLSPGQARALIDSHRQLNSEPSNFEEKAISLVGKPLYEAFIRGYTEKQWQVPPDQLPAETISRLPVRFNFDNRYFNDTFEGLPKDGYTAWAEQMIDHPNISIEFDTDYFDIKANLPSNTCVVYTGPLDKFFDYRFGALSWRTLDFQWEIHDTDDFQGTSVINYADKEVPFTRIHEFRHLHPERQHGTNTIIAREFSRAAGLIDEPYYPVNSLNDREILLKYRALADQELNVIFGGRLGTYKYLDMHMAIGSAISKFETLT